MRKFVVGSERKNNTAKSNPTQIGKCEAAQIWMANSGKAESNNEEQQQHRSGCRMRETFVLKLCVSITLSTTVKEEKYDPR